MSYALPHPGSARRSTLLSLVIGLHVGIFLLVVAAKTVVPQIMEMPLVVDLLPAPEAAKPPTAKPLPVVKPQPVKQQRPPAPPPTTPAPQLEATASAVATPSAPVAAPPEITPLPPTLPAAPAEPALSQPRFDVDYLNNPAPTYPPLSRRMGEEGKALLRVLVNPQGSTDSVEVKSSSGSKRLDDAAVNTVKRWKFIPAQRGDSATQSWVLVPIIFKLEK